MNQTLESAPRQREALRIAQLVSAGLCLLPWLQLVQLDFERSAMPLAFGPSLALGWRQITHAWLRLTEPRAGRIFLGGVALVITLSTLLAAQPAAALVQAANLCVLGLLALLVSELLRVAPLASRWLLGGIIGGGLCGVASLAAGWFVQPDPRTALPHLITWLYPHPRHIGLHLLPGAVIAPILAANSATRVQRGALLTVSALLATGLVWSGGRMPLLSAAAAALWVTALPPAGLRRQNIAFAYLAAFGTGFIASTFFWTTHDDFGWWRFARTVQAASDVNQLTSQRIDIWRACIPFFLERPWLGHGLDGYRFLNPKMDGQQPHNFLVQTALSLGASGLLLLAVSVAAILHRLRRAAPDAQFAAAGVVIIALLVGSLFDGTLYHALSTSAFALVCGFGLSLVPINRAPATRGIRFRLLGLAAGSATGVILLHALVFFATAVAQPPASPDAPLARIVRQFPSTTFGLNRWLDAWAPSNPDVALEWARWAQKHSAYAFVFHAWSARHLASQGLLEEARREAAAFEATRPGAFREALMSRPSGPAPITASPPEKSSATTQ
jgi:O-antigen ligase